MASNPGAGSICDEKIERGLDRSAAAFREDRDRDHGGMHQDTLHGVDVVRPLLVGAQPDRDDEVRVSRGPERPSWAVLRCVQAKKDARQ
ncbi:hypothetical protein A2501_00030 [Candidatus Uhrbacteria bacterium RIFOXYC12_FULL_57_11]|nr:MAG: hypothetical protein A2501_00030 [Candidatus Uhrbacteria bacterium RIFOXYC12_FULL_57_11]